MAENGRLGDTRAINASFEELMMASRGEVKCVVTSADVRAPTAGHCHYTPWPSSIFYYTRWRQPASPSRSGTEIIFLKIFGFDATPGAGGR